MNRLRQILAVLAKHGLKNLVEKINLGNFLASEEQKKIDHEQLTIAQRLRMSFEELGPTFVKFGQLLASRPDLIPLDYANEMALLHDQVQPLEFSLIKKVIEDELGLENLKSFKYINEKPIGSASIAQVHEAELVTGESVVIKIQRPGLNQIIQDDLNVLYYIAELIEKYIPETRPYNLLGMVDEYFKTLELETNFIVEANNLRRMKNNFSSEDNITIPQVYFDFLTEKILVMELLKGKPLSQVKSLQDHQCQPDEVLKLGLKAYLKMVFIDGFFHGDLHPGNFFIFNNNKIGLIDFGVVGRLNNKTQEAIVNMLIALSKEDYLRLAYEYVDISPYSESINVDLFARDLQGLIAPYYGLTLKNVNVGKILLSSSNIAANHGLYLPSELMLFFKSLVSIEGLGQKISKDFDFLAFTLSQVGDVSEKYFQPVKFNQEVGLLFRESRSFLNTLPRQLNLIFRRMNSPEYSTQIEIKDLNEFRHTFANSFNLIFLGLIISTLILSSSLLLAWLPTQHDYGVIFGLPSISMIGYLLASLLSVFAFYNYLKK